MKQKFNIITSTCVPLPLENVDTDQIIPARFLKATTREEKFFGDNLFRDWRYNPDGSLNKDFVLNNPTYGGQILVAAKDIPFQLDIAQIYVLADLYEIPHRIFEFNTVVHPNTRREGLGPADIVKITDMIRQRRRVQRKGRAPDDPHGAQGQYQH